MVVQKLSSDFEEFNKVQQSTATTTKHRRDKNVLKNDDRKLVERGVLMTYFEEAFLALAFLFEDIFVLRFFMENQKFLTPL